ncbi:MAG: hypothetical protein JWN60_758 [Acidobacteria bacterium]|jgi:hypothetical protein|nr:hypothetical protein [Acidobacteriota bacterium]
MHDSKYKKDILLSCSTNRQAKISVAAIFYFSI